jgi:ABC-type Fe3+-citrate transport system substrate-binding protein
LWRRFITFTGCNGWRRKQLEETGNGIAQQTKQLWNEVLRFVVTLSRFEQHRHEIHRKTRFFNKLLEALGYKSKLVEVK